MSRREITPPTVDRISALPDEMLIHILSFLPMKLAFTTTILSKRWTPLCNSLTTLRFEDEDIRDAETYLRFCGYVDNVMLPARVQHHHLKTFCFMSRYNNCLPCNVDEWVEAAKRRRVENIMISCTLRLLPSIFTSPTLVVLKLSELDVKHHVGSVDLPLLITLHLINVGFRKNEDAKKILCGCPNLVDLNASMWISERGYTTGYKTLPNLVKACISTFHVPFSAVLLVRINIMVDIVDVLLVLFFG